MLCMGRNKLQKQALQAVPAVLPDTNNSLGYLLAPRSAQVVAVCKRSHKLRRFQEQALSTYQKQPAGSNTDVTRHRPRSMSPQHALTSLGIHSPGTNKHSPSMYPHTHPEVPLITPMKPPTVLGEPKLLLVVVTN